MAIWTMGELLCEIMRPKTNMPLHQADVFYGPFPSGAPAIFIDTVARLGHKCGIIGGVGKDDFGKCLIDRLATDGVDVSHITEYDDGTTGVAFVTYFDDGSRKFLYHFPDTPATRATAPSIDSIDGDVKYFHIMGCSLMAKESFGLEILKLMRALVATGAKVSFDPNIRPELMKDNSALQMIKEVMRVCNVFLPGVSELLAVSGKQTIDEAIAHCFENEKLEIIVLKKGAAGCVVYTRNDSFFVRAYEVDAIDPTGAGDCFDGAFLCGLLEGKNPKEAAMMASAAAALSTTALGPMEGDINRSAIEKMIKE